MIDNKLFTLLLLVKGRHEFTKRWLIYMKEINFEHNIIIADGQDDDETENLIKEINLNNSLSIRYFRYNTHLSYQDYYKMKKDALNKVETDFVMLCDNDDFVIPSGLKQQIDFLRSNQEYISSSGKILNFEIDDFEFIEYGKKVSFLNPCKYYRVEEPIENWHKHIKSVFTEFQPNFYNVFRTKYLKLIANELVEQNFSDLVINEFYVQLRASTLGQSKVLTSSFHYIRQRGTSSLSKKYEFSKDILKKNMPEDIRKLANKISDIISKNSTTLKKDYETCILEGFSKYLNYYLAHTTLKFRFPKLYILKIKLLKLFREKLNFLYILKKDIISRNTLNNILRSSNKKNFDDLKYDLIKIQRILDKNYETK